MGGDGVARGGWRRIHSLEQAPHLLENVGFLGLHLLELLGKSFGLPEVARCRTWHVVELRRQRRKDDRHDRRLVVLTAESLDRPAAVHDVDVPVEQTARDAASAEKLP